MMGEMGRWHLDGASPNGPTAFLGETFHRGNILAFCEIPLNIIVEGGPFADMENTRIFRSF